MDHSKLRVLTTTMPADIAELVNGLDVEVLVGQDAWADLKAEFDARQAELAAAPPPQRGGRREGHDTGGRTHGHESTYVAGCRCAGCRLARSLGNERRRAVKRYGRMAS